MWSMGVSLIELVSDFFCQFGLCRRSEQVILLFLGFVFRNHIPETTHVN